MLHSTEEPAYLSLNIEETRNQLKDLFVALREIESKQKTIAGRTDTLNNVNVFWTPQTRRQWEERTEATKQEVSAEINTFKSSLLKWANSLNQ